MRKILRLAITGLTMAGLIGFSGAAHAADVYTKGGGLKDEPGTALPPVWAGLYVGGSIGYGRGDVSDTITLTFDPIFSGTGSVTEGSDDLNGAVYGAHLGYNFQYDNFVFGTEIGINGASMNAAPLEYELSGNPIKHDLNWYASAVGRLGYAYENFLFYGFGGVAWSKVETDFPNAANLGDARDDTTFVGWTAGVGVEYALSSRFSLRLEYAHIDLGSETNFSERSPITPNVDVIVENETAIEFDVVKVGASYRLGGGDEALK
jgi:outer membrane immunogenic protein